MTQWFNNLVELAEHSTKRYATRNFIGTKADGRWRWTSYAEFQELVNAFRSALFSLGVEADDKLAIVSNNRLEWAVAAHAAYGLGATFVPMYEAQGPSEREFILRDCGARFVIGSTASIVTELDERREALGLEQVIALDAAADDPRGFPALIARGRATPMSSRRPSSDAIALLAYTSGTTGKPKGAMLSHANLASNVQSIMSVFPILPDDVTLSFLPWAHVYGHVAELHVVLAAGASTAICSNIGKLSTQLAETRPTILVAVPRVFHGLHSTVQKRIAHLPRPMRALFSAATRAARERAHGQRLTFRARLALAIVDRAMFRSVRKRLGGRLRFVISGSAALSPAVAHFIDALGIDVYEGYGLTETSPIVAANWPGSRKIGSVGKPIPGVSVTIDESAAVEPGVGEIVVRGPNVMKGYHARPDENAKAFASDGSFRTGDLGRLDEDGFLYITGRIKEQYKLENGKYVMPALLEEQLKRSPFISNAMLYGANRPHNVALIVPNVEAVKRWADQTGVSVGDLLPSPEVQRLFQGELQRLGMGFRSFERPKAFTLQPEDFTLENGLLTPTLKLKREHVVARYREEIERLYQRVTGPEGATAGRTRGTSSRASTPG